MRGTPAYIGPFTGGLNTRDSVMELPNTLSPDLLNVINGKDGTVRKRDPSLVVNNTFAAAGANDVSSLFYSETQSIFIAGVGAKVYKSPVNAAASTDISGPAFPSASLWSFVEAAASGGQGPVYAMVGDGATANQQWTGAGNFVAWTASAGTLPKGEQMVYFKNRVITVGVQIGTNGAGVMASKVGDPRAWDTTLTGTSEAWLTNLDPNDGSSCTGMGTVGPYLIVFKKNKAYTVYDLDTGANRPLSQSVGMKRFDWRSIVSTPYGLCWMAQDGHVYVTDGNKITKLSDAVGSPSASGANYNTNTLGIPVKISADSSRAGFFEDKLYMCVTYLGGTTFTFVYDFITKTWWRYSTSVYQFANYPSSSLTVSGFAGGLRNTSSLAPVIQALYIAGLSNTAGFWQDNLVNYNAYYCTPALAPAGKFVNHNLRRRYHAMRGFIAGTMNIQMASDVLASNPPTYSTLQSLANRPVDFPVENSVYSLGVANNVQFKFTSTDAFAWELHPFYLYTQPRTD